MAVIERSPLSRERVADAALALGDAEGLDGLSMRKVGASLGVEAMSLYNHVANKDDLLDAIGDLLYAQILERYEVDPDVAWQQNSRALVRTFFDVAMEHPNMVSIMLDRPIPSITKLFFLQECYEIFVGAGYPPKEAALAFNTVAGWMTGTVHSELTLMRQLQENGIPFTRDDVSEEFYGAIEFMECCTAWTAEERLEAGFNTLLSGFEKELAENGWS
ncbi:MAG: TetR/AcrR family tetracycline transcriptional repressor [Verrucomicrobiales bacterium]|jgi:TetR/AcrR family tetracycline transcriptional repressor